MSTTVRVSEETRAKLRDLVAQSGMPIASLIERAVEEYRRKLFFEAVNAAYAALRADPTAWQGELAERRQLEGAILDDLDAPDDSDETR